MPFSAARVLPWSVGGRHAVTRLDSLAENSLLRSTLQADSGSLKHWREVEGHSGSEVHLRADMAMVMAATRLRH